MIDKILSLASENWQSLELDVPRPSTFRYILQSRNRVILFLFDGSEGSRHYFPLAVIKFGRRQEDNANLEHTVDTETVIRSLLPAKLRQNLPHATLLGSANGLACSMERFLQGEPIAIPGRGQDKTIRRHMYAFFRWLLEFQQHVVTKSLRIEREYLDQALSPYERQATAQPEYGHFARLLDMSQALEGVSVPLVWRYGDAHPSNILLMGDNVSGVVDWQGAAPDQWPIFDWFQFILSYTLEWRKKHEPYEGVENRARTSLDIILGQPSSSIAVIVQDLTKQFVSTYGLAPEHFPVLFAIFLAQLWRPGDKAELYRHSMSLLHEHWT